MFSKRVEGLIDEQIELSKKLVLKDKFSKIETIAGVDQSYEKGKIFSCIVVLDKNFEILEKSFACYEVTFPYIPGLLAYREMPVILKAYEKLKEKPDVILVDGHGIAHPRGFGLASHLGVILQKPTIGIAKRKLVGNFKRPEKVGNEEKLIYDGKIVGYALKTKENCREIFISPGNFISLESSVKIVKRCVLKDKLPEPLRLAHKFVNEYRKEKRVKILKNQKSLFISIHTLYFNIKMYIK